MNLKSHASSPTPVRFTPGPELIRAAENLFLAMAMEQQVRPIVEAYETAILAKHQFKPAEEYRGHVQDAVILDRKSSFLLSKDDAKTYFAECFAARDAAGLTVSGPDNCPLLEAEGLRMDAETAFIKELGSVPGLEAFKKSGSGLTLALRTKVIDIGLKLVAPYVRSADELLNRVLKGPQVGPH